ncbi:MAG: cyclase family protein [Nakamurella sp.]
MTPPLSKAEFDAVYDRLRITGTDVDERGAIARIDPDSVQRALGVPRTGRTVSLAMPIDRTPGPHNGRPALHHMVDLGDIEPPEPSAHKDFIGLDYHGKAVSHLDAVCHIGYRGELYGGVASRSVMSAAGSAWSAVTTMRGGVITRGVLIDLPAVRGVEWLEPGVAVHAADLAVAEEALGVRIGPADAVLLRTGHGARRAELGPWNSDNASAGWHVDVMEVFAERGISLLGGDGDSDVRPSSVADVHSPIHALSLTALGIPLLDNLDLEELSDACAQSGRYEFLLVVAPLVIPRGTGSPVNPIAVL